MRGTAPEFAIEDLKNYLFIKPAEIHSSLRIPPQAAPIFRGICPLLLSRVSAALRTRTPRGLDSADG
jgi:hypothetical protein